jgi:hypothetical protein
MAKIQSASTPGKETIYVDVDDEITTIIDKVQNAKGKIVALVLPKRATVLQSIVNMKLLQRTAENANKNLVLVTTEAGLLPLAGSVGLHVADTPTSKPAIPAAPAGPSDEPEDIDEPLDIVDGTADGEDSDFDAKSAAGKPVGELAAAGAAGRIIDDEIDESIDLDDGEVPAAATAPKPKKNKKLKVPNFDSFRKKIALAVLALVVLVVAWILAFVVLPHATVTIHTDSSTITSNIALGLDTSVKKLDPTDNAIPATAQSQQKTSTQTVPTTGQQNNGQKAQGTVRLSETVCAPNLGQQPADIPTGSSVTSGGNTYITQESASYSLSKFPNGNCAQYSTGSITITALKGGADYNTSGATFSGPNGATGSGSASGGTDDIVKIVAQSDIDSATSKITAADSSSIKQELLGALEAKGLKPVPSTFLAGTPQVTQSAQVGAAADNVTVTAVTTYTMLGVQKSDLKTLVDAKVMQQIDKSKQVILDDGIENASFTEQTPATATAATVSMHTKSVAGPHIDTASLKKQLAGKKSGDVKSFIEQTPGVTSVEVHYSPFWVSVVPKNTGKVTIQIDKTGKQ